jgi:hypothetical protein
VLHAGIILNDQGFFPGTGHEDDILAGWSPSTPDRVTCLPYNQIVRPLCPERDRLWSEYDAALATYAQATRLYARLAEYGGETDDAVTEVTAARQRVQKLRVQIVEHVRAHNCEPAIDSFANSGGQDHQDTQDKSGAA